MRIKIFTEMTPENQTEIVINAIELSYLMTDAGEDKESVYSTITGLIRIGGGGLYVITEGDKKIGFGVFSNEEGNQLGRRLYYFALRREHRMQGLGKKALDFLMKSEVSAKHGCTVACKPKLKGFYQKLGFEYCRPADNNSDEIILAYYDPATICIQQCLDMTVSFINVQPEAVAIFEDHERLIKENFGITFQ